MEDIDVGGSQVVEGGERDGDLRKLERLRNDFYSRVEEYELALGGEGDLVSAQERLEALYREYLPCLRLESKLVTQYLEGRVVDSQQVDEELKECEGVFDDAEAGLEERVEAVGRYEEAMCTKMYLAGEPPEDLVAVARVLGAVDVQKEAVRQTVAYPLVQMVTPEMHALLEKRLAELVRLAADARERANKVMDDVAERKRLWEEHDDYTAEFMRLRELGALGYWREERGEREGAGGEGAPVEGLGVGEREGDGEEERLARILYEREVARLNSLIAAYAEPDSADALGRVMTELERVEQAGPEAFLGRARELIRRREAEAVGVVSGGEAVEPTREGGPEVAEREEDGEKEKLEEEREQLGYLMEDLRRRRENLYEVEQDYKLAEEAVSRGERERKSVWGPSAQEKTPKYKELYGHALDDYLKAVAGVNRYISKEVGELRVSEESVLASRLESIRWELIGVYGVYRERTKRGVSIDEQARLLKELDLICDQRLGIFIEIARQEGRDVISKVARDTNLRTVAGRRKTVPVREIRPLAMIGKVEEEPCSVELTFRRGHTRDFVRTKEGNSKRLIEKRRKLQQAGVSVVDDGEVFVSMDNELYVADPSRGYKREVVDLPSLRLKLENHDNNPKVVPRWMRERSEDIVSELVRNAEYASSCGYVVGPEIYWFVYDPRKRSIGLLANFFEEATYKGFSTSRLMMENMRLIRDSFVLRFGLMTDVEWDQRFPNYAADKLYRLA